MNYKKAENSGKMKARKRMVYSRKAVKILLYDYAVSRPLSMRLITALISFSDGISNIPIAVK